MLDFNNTLSECGLRDIASKGSPFTWSNKRYGNNLIKERLDKFLCTQDWTKIFKGAVAYNVEVYGSDHLAIVIYTCKHNRWAKKYGWSSRFHYENFWSCYDDCKNLIDKI